MTVWNAVRNELQNADQLTVKQIAVRTGYRREKVSRVLNQRRKRGVVSREKEQVGKRRMFFYRLQEQ